VGLARGGGGVVPPAGPAGPHLLGEHRGLLGNLGFVFLGGNIINAIFEYALIALLLHPQSREHQKIWFD
jgi:hypothetical protein